MTITGGDRRLRMEQKRSSTEVIIAAMRILQNDIQSEDGVANAAIGEAADRLGEFTRVIHAVISIIRRDCGGDGSIAADVLTDLLE